MNQPMSGALPPWVTAESSSSCVLRLKVVPGARRSELAGVLGDRLKVRVAAPPEEGKANLAVVSLLASMLSVGARAVEVASGHSQPQKLLRVGLAADVAAARLHVQLRG